MRVAGRIAREVRYWTPCSASPAEMTAFRRSWTRPCERSGPAWPPRRSTRSSTERQWGGAATPPRWTTTVVRTH
jgi:hypothetical protein